MSLWIIFGLYAASSAIVHAAKRNHEWERYVDKIMAAGSVLFTSAVVTTCSRIALIHRMTKQKPTGRRWASDPANAERVKANSDKGIEAIRNRSEFDKALRRYKAQKYAGRKKRNGLWPWENA